MSTQDSGTAPQGPSHDPFRTYDAAYVLGALSPRDRAAYEAHLAGCADCARAVRELAGLPGLLALSRDPFPPAGTPAGTPKGNAEGNGAGGTGHGAKPAPLPPPPPGLLPALVERVTARRRRGRRLVAALSATAVALAACLALVLAFGWAPGAGPEGGSGARDSTAMTPLGPYPVEASVSLADTGQGSRVSMECAYGAGESERPGQPITYTLIAVENDGTERELARWQAMPGETARMTVGTPLRPDEIVALEVRVPGGPAVLRMPM
ncbi:zf-HC2 domain-containing protein [Streptomyces sp. 7-21]|uniref:zf-HC2 domain-containing protein n=1 Tax=Streptomyces sp. 7-21 TaxID=2802283 RepID=UPI00191CB290|nr:zf-HC2 domain-containing protein [Streptomyces sp. 7-21]MBL1068203.1 zf-HC2 domain-containing protein [Streptomyces sp. 7-21]